MAANHVVAETYIYTGNNYTNVNPPYTTAMWVSGTITTNGPIPPNSDNFDIRTLAPISWSFFDGVHTITDADGVLHPASGFAPKFTTDSLGNITGADIWASNDPIATEVNKTNMYIATIDSAIPTAFDHGVQLAKCTAVTDISEPLDPPEIVCTAYLFGPRGYVNDNTGIWTIAEPEREFPVTLPSGAEGSVSFTTDDPNCTFAEKPQFLAVKDVIPPPQDSVAPIDGVVQFSITSCAEGATVTMSVDYGMDLPAEAEFWKVGDPWFVIESSTADSVITFKVTDGGLGDDDGQRNGQIVDPGGASIADIFSDGFESE